MIYIGSHISSSGGYEAMCKNAQSLDADTFAFFTRNPRGGAAKDISEEDVKRFLERTAKLQFGPIVAHAPYTMNLCSSKPETREFGMKMLADDLARMEYTPGNYYNFHPGSHTGQGTEKGIALITDALNRTLTADMHTTVLLETMAGKGSEVGGTFEELRAVIDGVILKEKIGVCFDTCHTWDSGYDIVGDPDSVLQKFDDIVGIDRLCAIHINDSKNSIGSHKDRHERIGFGMIGEEAMKRLVQHPLLQGKPFILETPNDDDGYRREISLIRSWMI